MGTHDGGNEFRINALFRNRPHLWFVDPTDRALEAFELHEGQWIQVANAKDDEPVNIRPFDTIAFSLGDLWP